MLKFKLFDRLLLFRQAISRTGRNLRTIVRA